MLCNLWITFLNISNVVTYNNVYLHVQNQKDMKKLIGGKALMKLGSTRTSQDTDYLIFDKSSTEAFIHDHENDIDYINGNGNKFFAEIAEIESKLIGDIASPQSLLELKAFSLVQHCLNGNFRKADEAEFDMKFLCREFNLTETKIVKKYVSAGEYSEIEKVIKSVKR